MTSRMLTHWEEEVRRQGRWGHADHGSCSVLAAAESPHPEVQNGACAARKEALERWPGDGQGPPDGSARTRCGYSLFLQVAPQSRASEARAPRRAPRSSPHAPALRSRPPRGGFTLGAASGERVQVVHAAGTFAAAQGLQAGVVVAVTSCPSSRLREPVRGTGVG